MRKSIIIVSVLFLIGIDLISKFLFENFYFGNLCTELNPTLDIFSLCHVEKYIPIAGDYLGLQLAYNKGVAFSLPISGLFLQVLTLVITGFLCKYFYQVEYPKKSRLLDFGYVLIFSGALSHTYERIVHGQVVDFIAVKYFAILNFADIFISIGAFLIFCAYVFHGKHR